jgi:hypothetical protein
MMAPEAAGFAVPGTGTLFVGLELFSLMLSPSGLLGEVSEDNLGSCDVGLLSSRFWSSSYAYSLSGNEAKK